MRYRRADVSGGTYFFTVALADRKDNLLVREIVRLRAAIRTVKQRHPFEIVAMVVMPDHLRALWRLPPDDADYPDLRVSFAILFEPPCHVAHALN